MPRDKVGLVGRNGAGKTSLFRVLGGEAEPADGRVLRKGAFGYLPQDPRIAGVLDGRTAVAHVLSGRGVDAELERIEKLRIAMEERPDERNVGRYTRAEEQFRTNGGYAADSEARALAAGLGIGPDRIDRPIGVLSGGERRRVELARILFAGSDVLCLDEPTNHLDVDAKEWLMGFLRAYRGALLVISHDLDLLDEAITRVLHLDRPDEDGTGHLVEYRGTYSQYLARPGRRRGAPGASWPRARPRRSPGCRRFVDRFGAKASKASLRPQHGEAHRRASKPTRSTRHAATSRCASGFPQPPHAGPDGDRGRRPGQVVRRPAGVRRRLVRSRPRRAAARARPQRRRQDEPAAHPRRRDRGRPRHVSPSATTSTSATTPRSTTTCRVDESLLDNIRREVPADVVLTETELRGLLGMFGLSGEKVFQDAGTLSGGEKTKLALAMLMVGRNNLLLLDEPTNNLDPSSRQSVTDALRDWPGAIILVSHDTEFVEQLAPTKVLLMPDGDVDYFNPDWLELVALA